MSKEEMLENERVRLKVGCSKHPSCGYCSIHPFLLKCHCYNYHLLIHDILNPAYPAHDPTWIFARWRTCFDIAQICFEVSSSSLLSMSFCWQRDFPYAKARFAQPKSQSVMPNLDMNERFCKSEKNELNFRGPIPLKWQASVHTKRTSNPGTRTLFCVEILLFWGKSACHKRFSLLIDSLDLSCSLVSSWTRQVPKIQFR